MTTTKTTKKTDAPEIATKEWLLQQSFGVVDVELSDGLAVKIRPLSRGAVFDLRAENEQLSTEGETDAARLARYERLMVARALVEPTLTSEEVEQWQQVDTTGQLEEVTNRIAELSGMRKGATKEAIKQFRE